LIVSITQYPKNQFEIQYPVKDLNYPISKEIPGYKIQYQSTSTFILRKTLEHNVKALIQDPERPTTRKPDPEKPKPSPVASLEKPNP